MRTQLSKSAKYTFNPRLLQAYYKNKSSNISSFRPIMLLYTIIINSWHTMMVQNYNFPVNPQSKNQPFSIFFLKTADFSQLILLFARPKRTLSWTSQANKIWAVCKEFPKSLCFYRLFFGEQTQETAMSSILMYDIGIRQEIERVPNRQNYATAEIREKSFHKGLGCQFLR